MTTYNQIATWFDRGVAQGAEYMAVLCDTYDHSDYPVYGTRDEIAARKADPGDMTRVMEIYDLSADKTEQMGQRRCFAL